MEALKAVGVSRSYGTGDAKRVVLNDFSLTLEAGEFVALMGPSGSGKSTFLHLAAGLLVPEAGRVFVAGEEVSAMGDGAATRFRRRHEGVVFQSFNLVETLDVEENVVLAARLDHARVDRSRVKELLEKLGLSGLEKRRPDELSGGERQRVAIARALYTRPAVLLADEPTGNLDAKGARALCALLKDLNASERTAILLVTHDPVVASCATRVCFLKDGCVAASFAPGGDPAVISARYLDTYR